MLAPIAPKTSTAARCSPAVSTSSVERDASTLLLFALCDALPVLLDALAQYARASSGRHAALAWSVRQGGLVILGALEAHLGRPRTLTPKHLIIGR